MFRVPSITSKPSIGGGEDTFKPINTMKLNFKINLFFLPLKFKLKYMYENIT